MGKYRVKADVIADNVEAKSEEEAVARVAEIFSATLLVISATARLMPTKANKTAK